MAHIYVLFSMNYRLLEGIVVYHFGLLGFLGFKFHLMHSQVGARQDFQVWERFFLAMAP